MLKLTEYKSIVEVPTWSSDSKMIAFASDMEGSRDIFIIGADGIGLARLTDAPGEEFYPAWSPGTSYLPEAIKEPTAAPDAVCVNTKDSTYGFTPENPVQIGYDPRLEGQDEHECLPWLLGPQGQSLQTELIEEVTVGDASICKVAVSYKGKAQADVMYFDINNYEQPKAPVGYSCGSPVEYLKAISSARYQK